MATTKYFTAGQTPNLNAKSSSENESLTLAYQTYGSPKNPAVLISSCFSGKIDATLTFLYKDNSPVLSDYFVIVCGLLGASESSSPSNAHESIRGPKFPKTSYEDNVKLQHALCRALDIEKLHAYIGFSMGGQQAYYFATLFPDYVERAVVLASAAKTSEHNKAFLEGPRVALESCTDWQDGQYEDSAPKASRAFARAYATWALSSAWFRQEQWKTLGRKDVEDYLTKDWDEAMGSYDARDLLCMMQTWKRGDLSEVAPQQGKGLEAALSSIKAKVLLMPSRSDLYFPPEDSMEEVKHLKHGKLQVIESVWGHLAAGGGSAADNKFISEEVRKFLSS